MVKVKLEGLHIVKARGKFYVYDRATKAVLLKGFKGSRKDLEKHLQSPLFIEDYNKPRLRNLKRTWSEGTLGSLIEWYESECPKYQSLSEGTKAGYSKCFQYLRGDFGYLVNEITQADLYDVRDKCAIERKPRFADMMISALSSMFSQAVKRRKMKLNPALGMDKAHKADPNANREWTHADVEAALDGAPPNIKTALVLARYAGFRGQTIAALTWREYQDDPSFGKCFRVITKKNKEVLWIPATIEVQDHVASLPRSALTIATRADGRPWDNVVQMQTEVSHYLRDLEAAGKIAAGTTLHGLRVTYAASLRRSGADTSDVAAALGDKSERMGAHYTRHVDNESRVIKAFTAKKKP